MNRRLRCKGRVVLLTALLAASCAGQQSPPREMGAVAWRRDFVAAEAEARKAAALRLVLFQEVPG